MRVMWIQPNENIKFKIDYTQVAFLRNEINFSFLKFTSILSGYTGFKLPAQ